MFGICYAHVLNRTTISYFEIEDILNRVTSKQLKKNNNTSITKVYITHYIHTTIYIIHTYMHTLIKINSTTITGPKKRNSQTYEYSPRSRVPVDYLRYGRVESPLAEGAESRGGGGYEQRRLPQHGFTPHRRGADWPGGAASASAASVLPPRAS